HMGQAVQKMCPMCLIENGNDGKLQVIPQALKALAQIDQRVVVVAVVGLYRTGKSYLMNKLAGKRKGFALGATVQSKTKGIWMWCVPHPVKEGHTLVLLDTEGLGDVEKGDAKNDIWIFSLAVLLSSTLVYNSMGTIDNDAIQRLHYVTELTEHIKVKSKADNEDESIEFVRIFPSFVWTVRDFTLTLEFDGKPVTADEYLDKSLQLKNGHSKKVQEYNMPRSCLRNFFPSRKCFVFERPAATEKMKELSELSDRELEPSFVEQANEFCDYIYNKAEIKTLKGGIPVTGRLLGNLAKVYVDTICSNQVPCLENAVQALSQIENANAVQRAVAHYRAKMGEWVVFPTETQEELSQIHGTMVKEALKIFIENSFKDEDQKHQLELMKVLQKEYEAICDKNIQESKKVCQSIIKRVFQPLEDRLSSGSYMSPGGYRKYSQDIQNYIRKYRSEHGRGVMAEETLKEYLEGKKKTGETILAADQSLTEAEHQMEVERARTRALEQEKQAAKEKAEIYERMMKDQQHTYNENVEQLLKKMEEERISAMREHERVVEAKLKEQHDLLKEGFKEKAELLQKEIDGLNRQREKEQVESPSLFSTILDNVGQAASLFLPGILPKVGGMAVSYMSRFFK
uniref:Guanylate binding protein 1 n=1 Tax=Scleropages formosus TaxID=113540 RepID=A0A8C9QZN0_SCLFO